MTQGTCSIEGCESPVKARGWCGAHYELWRRNGNPRKQVASWESGFWAKVDRHGPTPTHAPDLGPCWVWTARPSWDGYITHGGRESKDFVHRIAYRLTVGPIPEGLTIDHLCFVKRCVNPRHLEAVTDAENHRRMREFYALGEYATHCKHGHEFTPENTWVASDHSRHCRACNRASKRRQYHSRRSSDAH